MNGTWKLLTPIAIGLLVFSCAQPASDDEAGAEPATPSSAEGPDPTVADPEHYKVEFENDQVRVLRIQYGPHEASVMHFHPEGVAVFLSDLHTSFTFPDGTSEERTVAAGQHMWSPAGLHQPENLSDEPLEVVQVELKTGAPSPSTGSASDPTESDPDHYTAEFENERVRVLRIHYGPGEQAPESHRHPDSVAVFLTDQQAALERPDGSIDPIDAQAGSLMFVPGGDHLGKNLADEPFELILIELK